MTVERVPVISLKEDSVLLGLAVKGENGLSSLLVENATAVFLLIISVKFSMLFSCLSLIKIINTAPLPSLFELMS